MTNPNRPSAASRSARARATGHGSSASAERVRSSALAFVPESVDERAAAEAAITFLLRHADSLANQEGPARGLEFEFTHATDTLRTLSSPLPEARRTDFEIFCLREAEMRGRGQGVPAALGAAYSAWFFCLLAGDRYARAVSEDAGANGRIREVQTLYARLSRQMARAHARSA